MGAGVRIFHGVDLAYGYNLSIEDGVTIRQRVLLDDRGGITLRKNAVIGSYSRIFSHIYAPDDYEKVRLVHTEIGPGARIGSHAIVLAGTRVGPGEIVGSFPADRA
jgi:acetyltransferase-like isoleucine patch superfamily enzyme